MTLASFTQSQRPNQVYPIFIDAASGKVVGCGPSLQDRVSSGAYVGNLEDFEYDYSEAPEGTVAIWPVSNKNEQCVWRLIPNSFKNNLEKGYIRVIPQKNKKAKNRLA